MIVDKMEICPLCAAMLYPPAVAKHREFHQAIVDAVTGLANVNENVRSLAKATGEHVSISRQLLKHAQPVKPYEGRFTWSKED